MLLGALLVLRGDLLDRWQQQLPAESPELFSDQYCSLEQVTPLKGFLSEHHIIPEPFYPIACAPDADQRSVDGGK